MADKVVVKLSVGNDPEQTFTVSPDVLPGVLRALGDAAYVPIEYPKMVEHEGKNHLVNSAEQEKALTEKAEG